MKTLILAATLIATIAAATLPSSANPYYLEPGNSFDGQKFFNSIRSGQ